MMHFIKSLFYYFLLAHFFFSLSACKKDDDENNKIEENNNNNDNKPVSGTVFDVEGNMYNTITIGSQTWMTENLRSTRYNDSTEVTNVTDDGTWGSLTTEAYCWLDNDTANRVPYGALYNWHAVNTGKLCPHGWHVPSNAEWEVLENTLGGSSNAGGKLKATGTVEDEDGLWYAPNTGATNQSGFNALPAGYRYGNNIGMFNIVGYEGRWWTSTEYDNEEAWQRVINNNSSAIFTGSNKKDFGLSVRCVKSE